MKIKDAKLFLILAMIALAFNCVDITFAVKQDRGKKGFTLVFNDKTTDSAKKHAKSRSERFDQSNQNKDGNLDLRAMIENDEGTKVPSSRRLFGASMGGGAIGGLAAGAGGAMINSMMNKSPKELIREKGIEFRSLTLKNDSEKENLTMLFHAKMNMSKLVGMTSEISSAIEFMIHRKLALLQQTLPDIAV